MNIHYKAPFVAGEYYHVFHHAVGHENLFREKDNYRYFLDKLLCHIDGYCELKEWCLMPNHFHLLIYVKPELLHTLSHTEIEERVIKCFADFLNCYTQSMNKRFKRRGSMFSGRFRRVRILDEQHLQRTKAYILNNPAHHQFTNNPQNWPYSSILLNTA
ncbi:MAG: transposase [Bacteroidetes bacterium]|nr:transposase [Bacteroidota bacterium]